MTGRRRLRIYSRSVTSILRECARRDIAVSRLVKSKDCIELSVGERDYPEMKALLGVFNVEFQTISMTGGIKALDRLKRHAFMIVGLIAGLVILAVSTQFVVKVDVISDNLVKGLIERALEDNNITGVMLKTGIDLRSLELKLIECIPEVTNASVYIDGMTLKVVAVSNEQPQDTPVTSRTVMSRYDGIVTRIYVSSGTPKVAAGDSVKTGDVLIDGYINTVKDEYAEVKPENFVPVPAIGEVYGKVYYHKRLLLTDNAVITERTGRSAMRRDLYLGSLTIGKKHKAPFTDYERVTTYGKLYNFIPVKVATTIYYEVAERVVDRSEYREWLINNAVAEITANIPANGKTTDRKILDTTDSIIDIYYEVEQRLDV